MGINAYAISVSDPGAIPGGSTNPFSLLSGDSMGPISFDGRVKVLLSPGVGHRNGPFLGANDNFAEEVRLAA